MCQVLLLGTEEQNTKCIFEVFLGRGEEEAGWEDKSGKGPAVGNAGGLCLGTSEQHHSQLGSEAGRQRQKRRAKSSDIYKRGRDV